MRSKIITVLLLLTFHAAVSQVTYFQGEWRVPDKADLFTCICKIDFQKDATVIAEFVWTFKTIDSADRGLMEIYRGKTGKTGVEFAKGTYNAVTGDIYLEATGLDDPYEILGMTKYFLKLSADNQIIYGNTMGVEVDDPGLFCAIKMKASGSKEFDKLKSSVKTKD